MSSTFRADEKYDRVRPTQRTFSTFNPLKAPSQRLRFSSPFVITTGNFAKSTLLVAGFLIQYWIRRALQVQHEQPIPGGWYRGTRTLMKIFYVRSAIRVTHAHQQTPTRPKLIIVDDEFIFVGESLRRDQISTGAPRENNNRYFRSGLHSFCAEYLHRKSTEKLFTRHITFAIASINFLSRSIERSYQSFI